MRLTENNIHHYLIDKGYLSKEQFIQGNYTLELSQSRNSNFKVCQKNAPSLFVKQLVEIHSNNIYLMQKEATAHRLFQTVEAYQAAKKFIAKLLGYDAQHQILVTELFPKAKNLWEIITEKKAFSIAHAKTLAAILSSFHQPIASLRKDSASLQFFNQELPWILIIGNIESIAQEPNGVVMRQILNQSDLLNGLEYLATRWQTSSLIHGDIKWVNFVGTEEGELKLIDWETAGIGDPLWDVAGVFQSYLTSWVFSFDNNNAWYLQKLQGYEYSIINAIQQGIQAFWQEYMQLKNYTTEEAKIALHTSTLMAGARLLQTAFESNQQAQLLPNTMRALQLCQHLFNHPEQIISELFGLKKYANDPTSN